MEMALYTCVSIGTNSNTYACVDRSWKNLSVGSYCISVYLTVEMLSMV